MFTSIRSASRAIACLGDSERGQILLALADEVEAQTEKILAENRIDLAQMSADNPMRDRLLLSRERLLAIASDIRSTAQLPSPLNICLAQTTRPNGLRIAKWSVPFGVIGVIYEARPNVTLDVFSLCFKSGNACVLKGGTDAQHSNAALVGLIHDVLKKFGVSQHAVALLPAGREATAALLGAVGYVDLLIPRGGAELIRFVRDHARVPVIETGAGICHTYFDEYGNTAKGAAIVLNAKTRRVSVCNALDCLIIHEKRLSDLAEICRPLAEKNVLIYADNKSLAALRNIYPAPLLQAATEASYGVEFLDYKMSIKTVDSIDEALAHIALHSSRHSEAIISSSADRIALFTAQVDAACVYSNASTAFTDGAQFGLGAEIGISTQKLHARGPMGLEALTTYKWVVEGDGQVRKI
jgi:glutamate-5-semialdehyde dehydrogenase